MRKNLYDSDKLIIIMYEEINKYQALFVGKAMSFSNDVCVPVPRYQHWHLFEHGGMPAMWNNWFLVNQQSSMIWLDWGWEQRYDFAQKQGFMNTYRTPEVDIFLESGKHGVMSVLVEKLDNASVTEMALIFPRAKIVMITQNQKIKTPWSLSQPIQVSPKEISPRDNTWVHGMDMWISNRQRAVKNVCSSIGIKPIQSEVQAFLNRAGEHLPGYKSSGHWGRLHTMRFSVEPRTGPAMLRLKFNDIVVSQMKINQQEDYYFEYVESSPMSVIKLEQYNMSHSDKFNIVDIHSFKLNDQEVSKQGLFHPCPQPQVSGKYTPKDIRRAQQRLGTISYDGWWQITTDGINLL